MKLSEGHINFNEAYFFDFFFLIKDELYTMQQHFSETTRLVKFYNHFNFLFEKCLHYAILKCVYNLHSGDILTHVT